MRTNKHTMHYVTFVVAQQSFFLHHLILKNTHNNDQISQSIRDRKNQVNYLIIVVHPEEFVNKHVLQLTILALISLIACFATYSTNIKRS